MANRKLSVLEIVSGSEPDAIKRWVDLDPGDTVANLATVNLWTPVSVLAKTTSGALVPVALGPGSVLGVRLAGGEMAALSRDDLRTILEVAVASSGGSDAGKLVALDASGQLDLSVIPGDLGGLQEIADDPSPELGGPLSLATYPITGPGGEQLLFYGGGILWIGGKPAFLPTITDPADGEVLVWSVAQQAWVNAPPAGGGAGESNTGQNIGGGVGVFDGKVGSELQFRTVLAGSPRLSVALDDPAGEITLDVDIAQVNLGDLGNVNTAGVANGAILYYNLATSSWVVLGAGSLNQVLRVNTQGRPQWQTLPLFGLNIAGQVPGPSAADISGGRFLRADTTWADPPATGETNTGQSYGTGAAVYRGKSGEVLDFRSVKGGSSKVTTSTNTNEVLVDVNVAALPNDAGSGTGDLWSASKIAAELATKLGELVQDITPQLGGNLDVGTLSIVSGVHELLRYDTGTGQVHIGGDPLLSPDITNPVAGDVIGFDGTAWKNVAGSGGAGEANTASNQGAGIGFFHGKSGIDLQLRTLVSLTQAIAVGLDGPNAVVTLDLDLSQASINDLGDVNAATPATGALLYYDEAISAYRLLGIGGSGHVLRVSGAGKPTWQSLPVFGTDSNGQVPGPTAAEVTANKVLRADGTWVDQTGGGGGAVDSVFGRTGAVVAASGDYTAAQVTVTPTGSVAATTVQAAIAELDSEKSATGHTHPAATQSVAGFLSTADKTKLDGIETGAKADQAASEVPFTPAGNIAATNVQTALEELDGEKAASGHGHANANTTTAGFMSSADFNKLAAIEAGATADQVASEVPFTPAGNIAATNVQAAIAEVDAEKAAASHTHAIADVTGLSTALAAKLANVVEDTTPQLGGHLDVNGQVLGDGTRTLLAFSEDPSGVNYLQVANRAAGSGPVLIATGTDTNVDLHLNPKGTGKVKSDKSFDVVGDVTVSGTVDGRDVAADGAKLDGIEAGATADQVASEVPFTPAGNLASTNVQAALAELDTEKSDSGHTHAHSALTGVDADEHVPVRYVAVAGPTSTTRIGVIEESSWQTLPVDSTLVNKGSSFTVDTTNDLVTIPAGLAGTYRIVARFHGQKVDSGSWGIGIKVQKRPSGGSFADVAHGTGFATGNGNSRWGQAMVHTYVSLAVGDSIRCQRFLESIGATNGLDILAGSYVLELTRIDA